MSPGQRNLARHVLEATGVRKLDYPVRSLLWDAVGLWSVLLGAMILWSLTP